MTWMAAATVAMMLPTAVPYFIAFGRDSRRPAAVAAVVAVYGVMWAVIGLAAAVVMNAVMLPATAVVAGLAIGFAVVYALTPLMRHGQARCQDMCREKVGDGSVQTAARAGVTYGLNCIACSAGVMVAAMVLGMANVFVLAAGAAMVLIYKLTGRWTRRIELVASIACILSAAWLVIG